MSLFTPLRGSFMYAPMYVKCIEHLHIDDDNWKNGQKQTIAGPPKHKLWQIKKAKSTPHQTPTATMTRTMINDMDSSESSTATAATIAMTAQVIEGSNSVARRPTSLLPQTMQQSLNTPVLANAPGFPSILTDDVTPLVITPTTLSSILDLSFTPTSAIPSPLLDTLAIPSSNSSPRAASPLILNTNSIAPSDESTFLVSSSTDSSSLSAASTSEPAGPQQNNLQLDNISHHNAMPSTNNAHVPQNTLQTGTISQNSLQAGAISHNTIASANSVQVTNSIQVPGSVGKRLASALDIEDDAEGLHLDSSLAEAAVSALTTGSLTPLVKEELKYAIQNKRLKTGKEELKVDYADPKPEKLSREEEERRRQRRERNRIAAQKCRNKRRDKMSSLEEESKQLQSANSHLKKQIRILEAERQKLSLVMRCHDISSDTQCPSKSKLSISSESPTASTSAAAFSGSDRRLLSQRNSLASSMSSEQAFSVFDETESEDSDTLDAFPEGS